MWRSWKLRSDAESNAYASLNRAEVKQITAVLRKEAIKTLPHGKYNIMTTETVMSQGSAVLEECSDENCVIKVGAAIGADYIVRGTVSKFGNMLTVSVDMYETKDGNLVASSELVRSENIVELLDRTAAASEEMYRTFVSPQKIAPKQEPSTPVAPTNQPSGIDGSGTFTDSRDKKRYKTVVIGGKRWMGENLNYKPQSGNSWCYDNDNSNCGKYGRLYDWYTARTVCPAGFHLPTRQEWNDLIGVVGFADASKALKSVTGWWTNYNGVDSYGFSALPGGWHNGNLHLPQKTKNPFTGADVELKLFTGVGMSGFWWTATVGTSNASGVEGALFMSTTLSNLSVEGNYFPTSAGLSVRCVADN